MDEYTLDSAYQSDDIVAKVIDKPAHEMTREGFKVVSESNADVTFDFENFLEEYKIDEKIEQSIKWMRLYGGGAILIGARDGKKLDEPLEFTRIRGIDFFQVFHRYELKPWASEIDYEVSSKNFYKPQFYQLNFTNSNISSNSKTIQDGMVKIHHSRIIRFEGIQLNRKYMSYVDYWGDSVISRMFQVLQNFSTAHNSVASIVADYNQMVFKMSKLADIVAQGKQNQIIERFQLLNMKASAISAAIISDNEEIENKTKNVTGLDGVLQKINDRLLMATDMPHDILFGDAAGGLGSTGESERRVWANQVKSLQESQLRDPINQLLKVFFYYKYGKLPEKYSIVFNSIYQPTITETLDSRKKQAEIDQIYYNIGVMGELEIRTNRFQEHGFEHETKIESGDQFSESSDTENDLEE